MKFKRMLAVIMATLMLATAFAGCGPDDGSSAATSDEGSSNSSKTTDDNDDPFRGEDNIKLTVWGPEQAAKLLKTHCDAFKALYPDKKIDIVVKNQPEGDAAAQVQNDPEAAADVFGFPSDQLDRLVGSGVIKEVLDPEDIKANNSQPSIDASTLDGKLYAFPQTHNGYMLVYDKSIVSDEEAKTIEGIIAACKKAGKKFIVNIGDGYYACMIPFTGGLSIKGITVTEDSDIQEFNDYDETKVVASMEAFAKLFHENLSVIQDLAPAKIASGFAQGTCGAGVDGSWNTASVKTALGDNYGVATLPTINIGGTDTPIVSMHGYKMLGVNKYSKFPEAAQLLAAYLTNEECQNARAEELGWVPTNIKAMDSDIVNNSADMKALLGQSEHAVPQVNITQTFWNPMADMGAKLINREEKYDQAALKTLLDKTITAIKDE